MQDNQFYIVNAKKEQMYIYQQICGKLGWDPIKNYHLTFWEISPEGCFFGKINDVIISSILALKYSNKYSFIALYWVDEKYRRRGYGTKILKHAMEYLKECQLIHLDSVDQQIQYYKKMNFKQNWQDEKRFTDSITQIHEVPTTVFSDLKILNFQKLCIFDEKYFPARRSGFLYKCFELGTPFFSMDIATQNILGYACVTPCYTGYAIGPFIAQNDTIAEDLIKAIFKAFKSEIRQNKKLVITTSKQISKMNQFLSKWFPKVLAIRTRMVCQTKKFVSDFDRSHIYSFSGFSRG